MEVTELISALQSHLDTQLSTEVLVSGSDQRPVPGVIIEDWNATHMDGSLNNYLTSVYDDQGDEAARIYRIPYECRVSFMVRGSGELEGSQLHDKLKKELMRLSTRPSMLSNSISSVDLNGGGGISHQFVNPSESEFNQAATFTTSLILEDSDYENIEEVTTELDIVN